jgi:hypothetical protein
VYFVSRTQIIVAVGAVGLALYVLDLVRRRRLSEEYSLLWVVCTIAIAVLGFSTPVLMWITRLLGMYGAASTAYSFGLMFAVVMLLYLSVKLSRIAVENQTLARELALLRFELERATSGRGPGKDAT